MSRCSAHSIDNTHRKLYNTKNAINSINPNVTTGFMANNHEATNGEKAIRSSTSSSLRQRFEEFSLFGPTKKPGRISMTNLEKWIKQANILRGSRSSTAEIAITYKELFRSQLPITYKQTRLFLDTLSKKRSLDAEELEYKLRQCGKPQIMSPRLCRKVKLE